MLKSTAVIFVLQRDSSSTCGIKHTEAPYQVHRASHLQTSGAFYRDYALSRKELSKPKPLRTGLGADGDSSFL